MGSKKDMVLIIIAFLLVFASAMLRLCHKNIQATLQDKSWKRDAEIENYITVKRSDWSVPKGGRVYEEQKEARYYVTNRLVTFYKIFPILPIYDTKFYYEIDEWKVTRNVTTEGKDNDPYWGKINLTGKERVSKKTETYTLIFEAGGKGFSAEVPLEIWKSLQIGDTSNITIQSGMIEKINGKKIN